MKILLFAALFPALNVSAQSEMEFSIVNKTGMPIYAVALENNTYGASEDLLSTELINNNDSDRISYQPDPPAGCKWDIAIDEYEDGAMHTKRLRNLDLCKTNRIIVYRRGNRYMWKRD